MKSSKYKSIIIVCLLAFLPSKLFAQFENSGKVHVAEQSVYKANDKLYVHLKLDLTALFVKSNLAVDIIPVLTGEKGEKAFLPKLLVTGRDRHILYQRLPKKEKEGQREVRRNNKKEQISDYVVDIPYEKWMGNSSLALVLDLCGCGWDAIDSSQHEVVDIRIQDKVEFVPALAYIVPAKEMKIRQMEGSAYLDFPVNKTVIYPDYRNNPRELQKIISTIDTVRNDPNATIRAVTIKGYASPEGKYANNARLAEGRAAALLNYVKKLYHFDGVDLGVDSEPEDWAGLDSLVRISDMKAKNEILAVIRDASISDPDARNSKLQRIQGGTVYRELLQQYYPALRHSDYVVRYQIRDFTVEEAKALIFKDPKQLSLEEMYRVAETYEPGSAEFNEVFEIAVRMYPDDPVSNLNAACVKIESGNIAEAEKYLVKAGESPEALNARGLVALSKGDKDLALKLFLQAEQGGVKAASENLKKLKD